MNPVSRKRKATKVPRKGMPVKIPRSNGMSQIERMEHPPQINGYEIDHQKRLRFTATAAAGLTITYQNLLDLVLVATTATVGFDLFDLVKVKQVEIWSQAALGTPSSISVVFTTSTGDKSIHTDTSLGVKPAYVKARPSEKSLASFWQASAAGNCFTLVCPAGSIIDVTLHLKVASIAAVAAQNALVAATAGDIYYRGLDGLAAATSNFVPPPGLLVI